MNAGISGPIRIVAQVDTAEKPAVQIGGEFLAQALAAAREGLRPDVTLTFAPTELAAAALPPADVHVVSLLAELGHTAADLRERLSGHLAALKTRAPLVFLTTIFRHLPDRDRSGGPNDTLARVRALNLLAIELSHALSIGVVDVDRAVGLYGAGSLDTDYRLGGPLAAGLAGHAFASAVLAGGLDDIIDPMLQEAARERLGGADAVPALLRAQAERTRGAG